MTTSAESGSTWYTVHVRADDVFTVPADDEAGVREYVRRHVKTGQLGAAEIISVDLDGGES